MFKNEKNQFLFITGDKYPDGDAGAVRTHSFVKMLESNGIFSTVVCMGVPKDDKFQVCDGVKVFFEGSKKRDKISRIRARLNFKKRIRKILGNLEMSSFCGIMYISGGKKVLDLLKKISKREGIPLFYDAVEWYSPSEFKFGKYDLFYKKNNNMITKEIDSSVNVIAISSYLFNYFSSKGIRAIRIPVILDVQNIPCKTTGDTNDFINIVYAGSPGKKDKLHVLVNAFERLNAEEARKFRVNIIGITAEQYCGMFGSINPNLLKDVIQFKGRISRKEVFAYLNRADFSFLARPAEERYAKAGFPTKVAEGLSFGVPMICNFSSDLDLYLKDEENSIIIDDCTVDSCVEGLLRLALLGQEKIKIMSGSARKTAEQFFDWRNYKDEFMDFLGI